MVDGRCLGHVVDIAFDLHSGCICGLIVPGDRGFWNMFKKNCELFIPYSQICKIGEDTILVEFYFNQGVRGYSSEEGRGKAVR